MRLHNAEEREGLSSIIPLPTVSYFQTGDSVCKTYDLTGGLSVGVLPLKALRHVVRETGVLPFDACVVCTSHDLVMRGRTEVLGIPECLVLRFEDVTSEGDPGRFTRGMAREVVRHLGAFGDAKVIGFACDAGTSRSAAMAAAFLRHHEVDDWCIWGDPRLSPNPLVYRVMAQAWGIVVTEVEAEALRAANELELVRAIRPTYVSAEKTIPFSVSES